MQRIREPRLLLVEGRDEVNLFHALIRDSFEDDPGIQVIDAGGKDKFSRNLKAIQTAATAAPDLRSIGVVRDADDDAGAAFDSVCDGIRSVNYEPPVTHGGFSNGAPAVGVFIVPDGVEPGAIETLCRQSRLGSATAACVRRVPELPGGAPQHQLHERRQELGSCLPRCCRGSRGASGRGRLAGCLGLRGSGVRAACRVSPTTRSACRRQSSGFIIAVRRIGGGVRMRVGRPLGGGVSTA